MVKPAILDPFEVGHDSEILAIGRNPTLFNSGGNCPLAKLWTEVWEAHIFSGKTPKSEVSLRKGASCSEISQEKGTVIAEVSLEKSALDSEVSLEKISLELEISETRGLLEEAHFEAVCVRDEGEVDNEGLVRAKFSVLQGICVHKVLCCTVPQICQGDRGKFERPEGGRAWQRGCRHSERGIRSMMASILLANLDTG